MAWVVLVGTFAFGSSLVLAGLAGVALITTVFAAVYHAEVVAHKVGEPFGTIVLRKAYGLGAQAMAGGSFHAGAFAISWPTGEFGGMGLEGAVKLGFRKELEAIADPAARRAKFDEMVAAAYARGKALSTATYFEVDEVIDPADSRRWVSTGLLDAPRRPRHAHKRRPSIDTW